MKLTLIIFTTLCLAVSCWAQAPQLEVFNPPTSTQSGYADLFNILAKTKTTGTSTVANGVAVFLYWGQTDNGCQSSTCAGQPPSDVTGTGTCAEADCFWGTTANPGIDQELLGYINGLSGNGLASHGQKLNLILVPVPEGNGSGGNGIPPYVFQPGTYSNWCPICSSSQPQDMVTCGLWPGDSGTPTGGAEGVWNVNSCNLTEGGTCSGSTDHSGFPVLYEAPFAEAWSTFVDRVFKHYSSSGSFNGPTIGTHLGYIRVGLAEGGENQPYCTIHSASLGIWPSPAGLSYDLANGITPNWYQTADNYPACATGSTDTCRGKDAYLEGKVSQPGVAFQGYVQTIWSVLQNDLATWNTVPNIMANTHSGPPSLTDTNYADVEACIFSGNPIGSSLCSVTDYAGTSGFGMEALSEWDVANGPDNCTDDWCYNFDLYHGYGLNLYLQTAFPNSEPGYTISSIASTGGAWEVTCSSPCATTGNGGSLQPLAKSEPVKIVSTNTNGTFSIASVINSTQFTISLCGVNGNVCAAGTGGTVYSMDYLPDTVPFAITNYADTLELYYCDWAYAFSTNSSNDGCATQESPYQAAYASVLEAH